MTTLLASLIGFLGSLLPEALRQLTDWRDKRHELRLLELQLQRSASEHLHRMAEIDARADVATSRAIYQTWKSDIGWVDALNGSVRPVIAYAFFLLYAVVKAMQFQMLGEGTPLPWQVQSLWSEEDQAIFAGIISFYFGQRSLKRRAL